MTKEKNKTHKQRTFPNDALMNVHSKDKRAWNVYQRMPKDGIRFSYVGLCGTRVTGPLGIGHDLSLTDDFLDRIVCDFLMQQRTCRTKYETEMHVLRTSVLQTFEVADTGGRQDSVEDLGVYMPQKILRPQISHDGDVCGTCILRVCLSYIQFESRRERNELLAGPTISM